MSGDETPVAFRGKAIAWNGNPADLSEDEPPREGVVASTPVAMTPLPPEMLEPSAPETILIQTARFKAEGLRFRLGQVRLHYLKEEATLAKDADAADAHVEDLISAVGQRLLQGQTGNWTFDVKRGTFVRKPE